LDRVSKMANSAVIDEQTKDQTLNRLQSAAAAEKEAQAKIVSAQALLQESSAAREKARADIAVAKADARRMAALLGYTRLTAAYAGVVTQRNVNTGDFVQPPSGEKREPLFVLERRDTMRVFVKVPEADAIWVNKGAVGHVRVQGLGQEEFPGTIARTSYSLDPMERTLLVEIDLPNPNDRLRPGMYAYASVTVEHPNVLTLPASAVLTQGSITQGFEPACFEARDGKLRRTPIKVGFSDGRRIEVLKKQVRPAGPGSQSTWQDFTGEEIIAQDNLSQLAEGQAVDAANLRAR
jgi:HlyD family secretion protein